MHAIRWLAIGLLGAALALAGCRSCDQPEQPDAAGGPAAAPAAAPAVDAGAEAPEPATDQAAAAAPEPAEPVEPDELREKLAKLAEEKKLRPGLARRMAGIPEPTAAEMADPELQHLNQATRRAHIIMVKAQQRMIEMYPPGDGPFDPQIDEAEFLEKLEAGKAGPGD